MLISALSAITLYLLSKIGQKYLRIFSKQPLLAWRIDCSNILEVICGTKKTICDKTRIVTMSWLHLHAFIYCLECKANALLYSFGYTIYRCFFRLF